jgi:hypothetical protein
VVLRKGHAYEIMAYHGPSDLLSGYQWTHLWTHLACDPAWAHRSRQGSSLAPWVFVFPFLVLAGLGSTCPRDASSHRPRCFPQRLVAALRTAGDVDPRPLLHPLGHSLGSDNGWVRRVSQGLPTLPQGVCFTAIGQQAVMANADKA